MAIHSDTRYTETTHACNTLILYAELLNHTYAARADVRVWLSKYRNDYIGFRGQGKYTEYGVRSTASVKT